MPEDPNTLKSRSLIRLVEVLSEGEIVGLENGAKSIYFDDTPYQSPDGTYNFKDVRWELRTGVSNQNPLPGFDSVESEVQVSRKVTATFANGGLGPYTFTINDTEVDAIRLKMRVAGLNTTSNSGKIKATSVSFRIEVQPDGGAYQTLVTDTISGKTTSPYERQYRIDLPGSGPWNVRVTRLTADSDQVNLQNDTYVASYTLLKDVKIRYNDTAVLGLVLTAEAFGNSIPARSFIVKGLKIRVPQNYDPETRTYATSGTGTTNGAWNGTFKTAWTNNPAWVFFDLLTNDRYGLGQYIDQSQVDKWALYDIAQYCDALVPDGFGGQEPRFTINAVISSAREAYDVLQTITSVFRGMAYWAAGAVTAVQDSPKDPVQVVNQTNVVDGQFTYTSSSLKDRHSVALITWNDPKDFYRPAVEVIEDPQLILRYGYRPIELIAYGCTSRGQAYRLGKWLLDTESSERETVSYTASFDHVAIRPGDIIEVADPAIAGSRQGGRILAGSSTTSIKLDAPIRVYSGDTLTTVKADGTLMERSLQPTASPVTTVTATSAFPEAPNENAVYAIGGGLVQNRPFRVVSLLENEKHLFEITAVTYDPNKFARVELGLNFEDPVYSNLTRGTVLPPINLLFQQGDYRANNQIRSYLVASWTQPDDPRISHYEYRVTTPSGGQDSGWTTTYSASVEFDNIDVGTWSIDVRCVTIDNRKSAYVTDDIIVTGRTVPPGTPTNLVAATGLDQISLTWTNPPDIDLDYIEVWGVATADVNTAVLANATQIAEVDSTAFIHTSLTPGDHWYYWVRAVDLVGNIGEYSTRADAVAGSASSVSSIVGYLTNESHTVATAVDGTGGVFTNAGGTFAVFEGTTDKTGNVAVVYSVVSGSVTGGLSISITSAGVYTVTNLTDDNGTAKLRAEYNGVVIDKVYSITKSKQGSKGGSGDASIVITMNADRQIFKYDGNGVLTPAGQYITLSLTKQNTTAVTSWSTSPSVTLYDTPPGGGGTIIPQGTVSQDVVYLYAADFGSNTAVTITATVSDGAVFTDKVTIVRVQDGAIGDPGENAIVGYLTNENHTVPASTTGVVSSYAGATGTFKVFWGTNDVSIGQGVTYSTLTNNQSLTNGGSGVLINASTGVFTIDGGLATGTDTAVVTFRATLPAGLGGGFVDKVFTLTKSKTGSTGADSKLLYIYSDKQTFTYDGTNTLSPAGQYIALTATKQNTTATVTWATSPSVSLRSTTSASSSIVTTGDLIYLHAADFAANTAVTVTATLSDGQVLTDKITIVRVKDGAVGSSALTGYLTNEVQTVPASSAGVVSSYSGATGSFKVFSGTTDISTGQGITYSTALNAAGLTNGGTGTLINASTGVYTVNGGLASGTDSATAVLRATLPAGFGGGTIDKVFTITKSKAGADGSNAKLLSVRTDSQAFTYDGTGGADPAGQVIRFDADKQNTTAAVTWSTSPTVTLYNAATGGATTTTGNTVYLRIADFGANNAVTVTATLTDGTTLTDTVTIVRIQDGAQGNAGADAVLYYIKATNGTAIKNGTGTLTVEARQVTGGADTLLSTGTIQLYVGTTLVNTTNGFATGSNGYTGVFDSGDITGDVIVLLKNGSAGTVLDSITLVDVLDGLNGSDAVYGYIEPTGPLAWTRATDQTTWTPSATTVDLPCTFVQGGVTVARASWRITRSATGTLTGATVAHPSGDLNATRITVTEINEGSQSFSVRFNYSHNGFTASVAETVITSLSGNNGVSSVNGILTNEAHVVAALSDGTLYSLTNAGGTFKMWLGATDVTTSSIFAITGGVDNGTTWSKVQNGLTLTINETTGVYSLSGASWTTDSENFTLTGTNSGVTITRQYVISKSKAGAGGIPATVYEVEPSVAAIVRNTSNVYVPANVTFSAYSKTGTALRTTYSGRFIIATSADGTTFTDQYTSTVDQASYTYTPPAGVLIVRARLYLAGGTATLLDQQSVIIVADGAPGLNGENATLYYIKPTNGTAIKNSVGTLTVQARKVDGTSDTLLSTGTIQLYVGTTLVTQANGFATGSNGYTGVFDSGDITGDVIVELKNGSAGTVLDSLTLVDVTDGLTGSSAVYAYCTPSGPTALVRGVDQTTWTPSSSTVNLDFTFVQGGADVARYRWVITRDAAGVLTGNAGTHPSANLNIARLTVTEINETTQSMSVRMTYSFEGATASLTETVTTALSGSNGANGVSAVNGVLTNESVTVSAASDGTGYTLTNAGGTFKVWSGTTDVTTSAIFNITGGTDAGTTWTKVQNGLTLTINETTGVYSLSGASWTTDSETFTITATYTGATITRIYTIAKARAGASGADAVIYQVEPSVTSVLKNQAGTYLPTTVTFDAYSKTGNASRLPYEGRFIIATSADGSTFTDVYTTNPAVTGDIVHMLFNGTNGSVTMTDSSGKIWTARGNAQLSTSYAAGGTSSLLLDGNGDWIDTPTDTSLNFGTEPFAIAAWVRPSALTNNYGSIVANAPATYTTNARFLLLYGSAAPVVAQQRRFALGGNGLGSNSALLLSTTQAVAGTAYYVEVSRDASGTARLFVNGVLQASASASGIVFDFSNTGTRIGANGWDGVAGQFAGHIDSLRIRRGSVYNTSNYTPPTEPVFSPNESSYRYTVPANVSLIRARLYLAGGVTTLVDQQSVAVVADGTNGTNGTNGLNVATAFIYQRTSSTAAPALPSVSTTYTFATGALTGLNNGWTSTIPTFTAGNIYLWISFATASSTATTDTIGNTEWAAAQRLATDGTNGVNGLDGYNTATLVAYKRSATAPVDNPGTLTYTFATAAWTPANGWSKTVPTGTAALYVTSATAYSNTATDSVASTDWSTPSILVQNGTDGTSPITMTLTRDAVSIMAYSNGTLVSPVDASGQLTVWQGNVDVTASATLSATASTGVTGSVNTALNTPVSGAKGSYRITAMTTAVDTGTLTLSATYASQTVTRIFSVSKSKVGYEIVSTLPTTDLFEGRVVFRTSDDKLYRYTGTAWTLEVDGADIKASSIATAAFASSIQPVGIVNTAPLPTSKATTNTDTIFYVPDGKLYRWNGSAYTAAVSGLDIVADSITAGQIAAGAVSTSELAAGAITAKKLAIFDQSKLFSEYFDTFLWAASTTTNPPASSFDWLSYEGAGEISLGADGTNILKGGKALFIGNNLGNDGRLLIGNTNIVFDPDVTYKITVRMRCSAGPGTAFVGLAGVAADGITLVNTTGLNSAASQHYVVVNNNSAYLADGTSTSVGTTASHNEFVGYVKGHAASGVNGTGDRSVLSAPGKMHLSTRFIRPLIAVNYPITISGTTIIDVFEIEKVSNATLIEPGSISTDKIAANAVTANNISAGSVTAAKLAGTTLSALKAELGDVVVSTSGSLRSGQTAYNTGTGFWLGTDAGTPKFSIGNPASQYLTWNGQLLDVSKAQITDGLLANSVLSPESARIVTNSLGYTAPLFIHDVSTNMRVGSEQTSFWSLYTAEFYSPDWNLGTASNFHRNRIAKKKVDFYIVISITGGSASDFAQLSFYYQYMIGSVWQTESALFASTVFKIQGRNAFTIAQRFTTSDLNNWQKIRFRLTPGETGRTFGGTIQVNVHNSETSGNAANSFTLLASHTDSLQGSPSTTTPSFNYLNSWNYPFIP